MWRKSAIRQESVPGAWSWLRLIAAVGLVWWIGQLLAQPGFVGTLAAQEEKNPTVGPEPGVTTSPCGHWIWAEVARWPSPSNPAAKPPGPLPAITVPQLLQKAV